MKQHHVACGAVVLSIIGRATPIQSHTAQAPYTAGAFNAAYPGLPRSARGGAQLANEDRVRGLVGSGC
jgi:hypothetical protein